MKIKLLIAACLLCIAPIANAQVQISGGTLLNAPKGGPQVYGTLNGIIDGNSYATIRTSTQPFTTSTTPLISATTYTAGWEIGPPENIANVFRGGTNAVNYGAAINFKSIVVQDNNAPSSHYPITFLIFDSGTATLTGTYANGAIPQFTASDLSHLKHVFVASFASYVPTSGSVVVGGTNVVSDVYTNNEPLLAGTGTGIGSYAVIPVCSGTGAVTSGTGTITFTYGVDLQ
jgi:hypothetical protein